MVLADGPATFDGLERALDEGLVDKVGFTGSTEVGRRIGELAGRHLQTPCLELGGKNPLVVMPDADLDLAVEGALFSGFGTAGQRCTSLGTAIVHATCTTTSSPGSTPATRGAAIGDPTQDVLYGPMISARFCDRFEDWLELDRPHHTRARLDRHRAHHRREPARGLRRRTPRPASTTTRRSSTASRSRTTCTRPRRSARSSASRRSTTFDEAIALANGHGYGLSASIYTTNPLHAFRFRERITAGMVSVNNSTSGAEAHLPFGGNGKSGQRLAAVRCVGARPVHALAGDELGLLGHLQKAQMDVADVDADLDFRLPAELIAEGSPTADARCGGRATAIAPASCVRRGSLACSTRSCAACELRPGRSRGRRAAGPRRRASKCLSACVEQVRDLLADRAGRPPPPPPPPAGTWPSDRRGERLRQRRCRRRPPCR